MNKKEIRWKQRFENYKKSVILLEKTAPLQNPTELERAGVIQIFELCFELAWKTLKDYLESKGQTLHAPRDVLKQAFQDDLIQEGTLWLKALEDRNLSTHLYKESVAKELLESVTKHYLPLLVALKNRLENEL